MEVAVAGVVARMMGGGGRGGCGRDGGMGGGSLDRSHRSSLCRVTPYQAVSRRVTAYSCRVTAYSCRAKLCHAVSQPV